MMIELLMICMLVCGILPCVLFLWNVALYKKLPHSPQYEVSPRELRVSVLIPARNEEKNIESTLRSVLENKGVSFEVIVLDDHSTDNTVSIVSKIKESFPNLRLEHAPPLPEGWCGKQHACHVLAGISRTDLLVFMDADVRLADDAIARMVSFMDSNKAALASGVPRQELGGFGERLLIPQIHFILLCFLPIWAMRKFKMPSMSGGCGQLFIAQRLAYEACGGHKIIRDTLHDGLKLPRVFRDAGFPTDLFDATDISSCRMYSSNKETWIGLGKNAHEGLGARATILPMTLMLLFGQALPPVIVVYAAVAAPSLLLTAAVATLAAMIPRLVAVARFKQPLASALLHPLGIIGILVIQWSAFYRQLRGIPSTWKGRSYLSAEHTKAT